MMTMYKITAFGGMEGRNLYTYYYDTLENAYNHIRKETWEDGHTLYELNITTNENGLYTATETRLPRPKTAREIKYNRLDKWETYID